jgi:hypothetical protein
MVAIDEVLSCARRNGRIPDLEISLSYSLSSYRR